MSEPNLREVNRVARLAENTWIARAKLAIAEAKLYEALSQQKNPKEFQAAYKVVMDRVDKEFRDTPLARSAVEAARYIEEWTRAYANARRAAESQATAPQAPAEG